MTGGPMNCPAVSCNVSAWRGLCEKKNTRLLICDEMTTMLDALNQAHIWNYVLKYAKQNNITLIAITHNKYLAEKIANRIIKLPDLNHIDVDTSDI